MYFFKICEKNTNFFKKLSVVLAIKSKDIKYVKYLILRYCKCTVGPMCTQNVVFGSSTRANNSTTMSTPDYYSKTLRNTRTPYF